MINTLSSLHEARFSERCCRNSTAAVSVAVAIGANPGTHLVPVAQAHDAGMESGSGMGATQRGSARSRRG